MTDRLVHDVAVFALLAAIGLGCFLVFDVGARFSYVLSDRALVMRWHVLRHVPWASRTIPYPYIAEVHAGYRPGWFGPLRGQIFGHFFKKGVITIILNRRVWMVKRYYITPDDPRRLLAELRRHLPPPAAR